MKINGGDGPKKYGPPRYCVVSRRGRNISNETIYGERYLLFRGDRSIQARFIKIPDFRSAQKILAPWGQYGRRITNFLEDRFGKLVSPVQKLPDLGLMALRETGNNLIHALSFPFAGRGKLDESARIVLAAVPAPWNLPSEAAQELGESFPGHDRVRFLEVASLIHACRSFLQTDPKLGEERAVSFVMAYSPRKENGKKIDIHKILKLISPSQIAEILQAPFFRNGGLPRDLQETHDNFGIPYFFAEGEMGKVGLFCHGKRLEETDDMLGLSLNAFDAVSLANRYTIFVEDILGPEREYIM